MLLGAALGGVPAAGADGELPAHRHPAGAAPSPSRIGDLDGANGKDIAVALPSAGSVGVMLNHGDGTFARAEAVYRRAAVRGPRGGHHARRRDPAGAGQPLLPDGKLDAYVACTPYVVRLTGNGAGALQQPRGDQSRASQQYLGADDARHAHADAAPGRQSGAAARPPARGGELRRASSASATSSTPRISSATPHAGAGAAGRRRPQRERRRRATRRDRHLARAGTRWASSASPRRSP